MASWTRATIFRSDPGRPGRRPPVGPYDLLRRRCGMPSKRAGYLGRSLKEDYQERPS